MKIISKFKDYYDSLQTHEGELYLREKSLLKDNISLKTPCNISSSYPLYRSNKIIREYLVGFCGKLYCGLLMYDTYEKIQDLEGFSFTRNGKRQFPKNTKLCWKIEDVDKVFENSKYKDHYYNGISKEHYWKISNFEAAHTRNNFQKFFTVNETKANFDLSVPVFVVERPCELITEGFNIKKTNQATFLNDCLKDIEFFKIMPVNQAFQEIEMFVNNIAKPEKPIPVPDDVTMAEIKGFTKYSFRKDKQKK